MISPTLIRQQVERLRYCNFYPSKDPEPYIVEISRALQRSKNESIVVAVIDCWLLEKADRPTPAEIYGLVAEQNDKLSGGVPVYDEPDPMTDEERAHIADLAAKSRARNSSRVRPTGHSEQASMRHLGSIYGHDPLGRSTGS